MKNSPRREVVFINPKVAGTSVPARQSVSLVRPVLGQEHSSPNRFPPRRQSVAEMYEKALPDLPDLSHSIHSENSNSCSELPDFRRQHSSRKEKRHSYHGEDGGLDINVMKMAEDLNINTTGEIDILPSPLET